MIVPEPNDSLSELFRLPNTKQERKPNGTRDEPVYRLLDRARSSQRFGRSNALASWLVGNGLIVTGAVFATQATTHRKLKLAQC
jgi:hypothetical protein